MAEKKIKENCLERMRRIDGERKIADFIVKQKQNYSFKKQYAQTRFGCMNAVQMKTAINTDGRKCLII